MMISLNVDGSTKCIIDTQRDVLDSIERSLGPDPLGDTCLHGNVWGLESQEYELLAA